MDLKKIFREEFDRASSFAELFELVKAVVTSAVGKQRSGLMLALQEMGIKPNGFVGGFHPVGSNVIVMNKTAARLIQTSNPKMYKAYCFHILLHEYLHTLGFLDEANVRDVAHLVSKESFGERHPATVMSLQFEQMLKGVPLDLHEEINSRSEGRGIEIVGDFDSGSTNYIG